MTQTFDLNKLGLAPMSEIEIQEIGGGGIWKWVAAGVAAVVEAPVIVGALAVASVVDAAYDFGKGVVSGWNSVK